MSHSYNNAGSLLLYICKLPQQKSIDILASDTALRSLMCKITLRRAYDVLRRRKRSREDLTTDEAMVEHGDESAILRSQAQIDVARLEQVYSAMDPIQRFAHILHHFYGYKARECAAMLSAALKELRVDTRDLTEAGIETKISRATKALKRAMEMKS